MPRRSRLPPPAALVGILLIALLISATLPPAAPPNGCCAVATAVRRLDCTEGSCWNVTLSQPHMTWLPPSHAAATDPFQLSRARCCALGACIPHSVPCTRTSSYDAPEDPSDALWLRAYNGGAELQVLARAGALALIFFLTAIIIEGAIFHPRRSGVAHSALVLLSLLALSALLQLTIIPRELQPAIWGAGPLQSFICMIAVIIGAILLPAVVLTLQAVAVLLVHYCLLLVQVCVWVVIGLAHFIYVLAVFYVRNLFIQLRVLYAGDGADEDSAQDVYISQLNVSYDFVSSVSVNALLRRVAAAVNNTAKLVLRSTIGSAAYNQDSAAADEHGSSNSDPVDADASLSSDHLYSDQDTVLIVPPQEHTPLLFSAQLRDDQVVVSGL